MQTGLYQVEAKGIGRPDYSDEISEGQIRPGLRLKVSQSLLYAMYVPQDLVVVPYAIPWIQGLLAPGGIAHLIMDDTGLAMPYTVPRGYILSLVEGYWTFNQDAEVWIYFDGLLTTCVSTVGSGLYQTIGPIIGFSSAAFDPTGVAAHLVDIVLINRGAGNMRGEVSATLLLEAVGTPPFPTEKDCKCPFCGTTNRVSINTSRVKCQKCGKDFITAIHRPGGIR